MEEVNENSADTAVPRPNSSEQPDDSISSDGSSANKPETAKEQPAVLSKYINASNLSFDDFNFSQMIIVVATGSEATVYCYDKAESGEWRFEQNIGEISGHVGKNGVSASKNEGDGCTPAGLYKLGYAFGNEAKPETALTYREITASSYWIDDPRSSHYNEWIEGDGQPDWSSAEKLSEHKNYAYSIVIEYNMKPVVPGKGSAIFLHCGDSATVGCLAVPKDNILQILSWLKPNKIPHIFIVADD